MRRREALSGAGAVLALALSGCSDGDDEGSEGDQAAPTAPTDGSRTVDRETATTTTRPAANLRIDEFRIEETDEGNLVVVVTVENVAEERESGVLVVLVDAGDDSFERERRLDVEGNGREVNEFEFPVSRDAFRNDGRLDFAWREAEGQG